VQLPSRNRPQHNKWLSAFGDGGGERGVGRVVGEVLFAGLILTNKDAQEGTALGAVGVADGSLRHPARESV